MTETVTRKNKLGERLPVFLIGITYLAAAALMASGRPLWYDEIFTFYVSRLDGSVAIVEALLNQADINPPIDYIVRHLSMRLFGESELAFRLPSIIALLTASLCLYLFARKRTSPAAAIVAFVFPLTGFALQYSHEGRAYSLLLAAMCLALLAWQCAADRPGKAWLVFLMASLTLGPYLHYYGVLNYAPIIVGEAWRSFERRKIYWPIVFSIVASMATLPLLYPLVANAADYSANFWAKFGPATPLGFYVSFFSQATLPLIASATGILIFAAFKPCDTAPAAPVFNAPRHEVAAAVILCLVPFMAYTLAELHTNALSERYAIVTIAGGALLAAYAADHLGTWRRAYGVIIAVSFALYGAGSAALLALKALHVRPALEKDAYRFVEAARLPVVVSDPHLFLPLQHYLPKPLRGRIYYLSDAKYAAERFRYDTNDRALERIKSVASFNVVGYCAFVARHREFLVLEKRRQWLVPRLLEEKAVVTLKKDGNSPRTVIHVRMPLGSGCEPGAPSPTRKGAGS